LGMATGGGNGTRMGGRHDDVTNTMSNNNDDGTMDDEMRRGRRSISSGEALSPSDPDDYALVEEGARFSRYQLAIYTVSAPCFAFLSFPFDAPPLLSPSTSRRWALRRHRVTAGGGGGGGARRQNAMLDNPPHLKHTIMSVLVPAQPITNEKVDVILLPVPDQRDVPPHG
jgi:hypothetical protein